jgi:hypothetical protein
MKNLNKFTKTELINKIKNLNKNNNNQSLFSKILGFIIHFKSFLLKLTLISFIIT